MPFTLAGPMVGNWRSRPSAALSQLHPVLQVLERLEREVEEVARAAGGIEDGEGAQPLQEVMEQALGAVPAASLVGSRGGSPTLPGGLRIVQLRADQVLGGLPFRQPGADDDRLDDEHDLVAVGVVRAQLRALAGVQTALEQRAQDGRVDLRPVQRSPALRTVSISARVSGSAESSSKSPPSNQATDSNPTRPPSDIAPNRSRARSGKSGAGGSPAPACA